MAALPVAPSKGLVTSLKQITPAIGAAITPLISTLERVSRAAPPSSISPPKVLSKRAPSAINNPAPPSVLAEPPTERTIFETRESLAICLKTRPSS